MARLGITVWLFFASFPAWASDSATVEKAAPVQPYLPLRFDEVYTAKGTSAQAADWAAPLKFVPLTAPASYFTLGGELRERFEGTSNPGFGLLADHNTYWLQRATLLGDLHLDEHWRIFSEVISGVMEGESVPAPPTQEDHFDLQFAFLDWLPLAAGSKKIVLRVGRFGMALGSGRLVATRAAPNIPFKFEGAEAIFTEPTRQLTTFVVRPVVERKDRISTRDHSVAFWGAYSTHWFDEAHRNGLDAYYLGINRKRGRYASGTGNENRHTFGLRYFGAATGWDWNTEAVIQGGKLGDRNIRAWTASLDGGYTLTSSYEPRIGLKADIASGTRAGSRDQGTFDGLYFKAGYFNDASLLRPANIIDFHPNLSVNLSRSVSMDGGVAWTWRYSRADAIYAPPGAIALPALNGAPSYLSTAWDVSVEWKIRKHLTLDASYTHAFTGTYVRRAGGGDVDYISTTLCFIF